jgi:hypothetical protein
MEFSTPIIQFPPNRIAIFFLNYLHSTHHSTMSDTTFDHKLAVVTSWLKSTFKDRAVPEFEVNEQTVSALYELAIKNKRRNQEQQLIINNNNRLAQEYQDEGELRN